jgi:hypothetical protein
MRYFNSKKSIIAWLSTLLISVAQITPIQAAMVENATLMNNITRIELIESLDKDDVQGLLVSMGVDKDAAVLRIQTMHEDELARLQQDFEQLPAGAGGIETIAIVFLILVATDYAGVTDIFPFVNKSK